MINSIGIGLNYVIVLHLDIKRKMKMSGIKFDTQGFLTSTFCSNLWSLRSPEVAIIQHISGS